MIPSKIRKYRFAAMLTGFCLSGIVFFLACAMAQSQTIDDAEEELLRGKYSAAITSFTRLLQADPNDARAQRGLIEAHLETGQYAEVEKEARRFLGVRENEAQARLYLGEVLARTGRITEAISEFEKARRTEETGDRLRADLRRAELIEMTGREEPAIEIYNTFVSHYENSNSLSAEELTLVAQALAHLERYQEANDILLEAISEDEEYIEAHLFGGELYTSKYNYAEAADFFKDALKINPNSARAHLGVALNKRIEGGDAMNAALKTALKINPNYVEAMNFAATLDLEAEKFQAAADQIEEALGINPNSLDAHALKAAMFWLQDKPAEFEKETAATLAINPKYGMLYEVLAHFATQTRRYSEGVSFLFKAVQLSPKLWSSHLALGTGLLRLGQMDEGRAALELAFKGDPFNIWAKNTLDLLDSMKDYKVASSDAFIIRSAANEADILIPYASDLLNEVESALSTKYKFKPRKPISVEIFPNHEDFAVRALGLPGLGALGVCFGQVIAQDSPSARPGGQFNWGSTLWHEYAHVITLQITDHMIPRWFSEGLSVFEEHNARPGWGDDWNAESIRAFAEGKWFTIANLDNGFIRPKRPNDVALAYFQASQVCHFINDRYGFDAILQMLKGYKDKKKTPDILQQTLKLSEAEFDQAFNKYVREKIGDYITRLEPAWKNKELAELSKEETVQRAETSPDDFFLNLRAGLIHQAEGRADQAIPKLRRAIELFPYQIGPGNPYEALAGIYEKREDKAAAASVLEAFIKVDENNYKAVRRLAELKQELGEKKRARELFRLSFYINPFEHGLHTAAGNLLLDLNDATGAVAEFHMALAAQPPNVAEAHYNIARAWMAAGKNVEARRAVLKALEVAPGFDQAQDLLLKLTGNQ
ncbi:MAG: tetratricopeptide repeat protein [Acidobacteriota bacterium]|nr:MAG: tetratricopeptide repeat protein [Acidobacteriota bacterium]